MRGLPVPALLTAAVASAALLVFCQASVAGVHATAAGTETLPSADCRSASVVADPKPVQSFADSQAAFAVRLMAALPAGANGNVTVSPFGVAAVLAALDLGADAKMKAAIAKTLGLGSGKGHPSIDDVRRQSRLLAFLGDRPGGSFASANGIFVDDRIPLTYGIEDLVLAEVGVSVEKLDFSRPDAGAAIDKWVAVRTSGRMTSVIEPGSAPDLVAANAFIFKDCWRIRFDPTKTSLKPFHRADGSMVDRPMMQLNQQEVAYAEDDRFFAVELPYADDRFVMTLVSARDSQAGPKALEGLNGLAPGRGFKLTNLELALPKFVGENGYDLLQVLAKLGLSGGLASSSQLAGFAPHLSLSAVQQKTLIKVDENGTEAAAATAAEASRSIAPRQPSQTVKFDRPFGYVLRYRPTGAILIAGFVNDPQFE